ncbi:LOW QUALITY PROTEIN: hypothetical protein PHMEG_00016485 [Phytophthora megakarya]|uniref:Reverse transcriptase domain-containing protein n=1 Tax=Phytophthora megakarya TaxID=4795 RepID=A0A225VZ66_9STRA|nr:LOW QUALITY PROTEIN: hypothetical protein PHMEG_00016485 [Phytophthora megakarya]
MEESAGIWVANTGVTTEVSDDDSSCRSSDDLLELNSPEATPDPNSEGDFMILEMSFISVGYESAEDDVIYVHEPADAELTNYAQELAFLPDFSDHSSTELAFSAANVLNSALLVDDQAKLVNVLKTHRNIMIARGNALPPPAYGVVCDINVEDHAPIKQRARRIPIRYLQKLYELLKGLLKAILVSFSDGQWDSPIVIVLKKNGEDIRLCIDYKMVNAVTAIMKYAMPLGDDLLTDLDFYVWFCSLDAASGFWAIMMTRRARKISAFVCPLGHFDFLRMSFGLKNAPMIYQRMIDNALWGFVQPKGGWRCFAEKIKAAEDLVKGKQVHSAEHSTSHGTFDDCLTTLDRLLAPFTECRISFTKSIFVQPRVEFLSHEISHEGIRANTKTLATITKLSFPRTKKRMQSFLGALNYYSRFIQDLAVFGAALYQLKNGDFEEDGALTTARRRFDMLKQ